ncbi:MAG: Hsp20/alpha crystallin family protein [Chloroflexi bacterium]|nr:Hsp20/alpha crystallin family protein [Chloroflexota bacterium]MQC19476.1 Hsp20/alpha crystallin family protein [Chloroflexota bacterium]
MADIMLRDPVFSPVRQMMERMLDDSFFREPLPRLPLAFSPDEGSLALDVFEKDGALKVEASLPGFKKEEIDVRVEDGVLAIRAHRTSEQEEQNGKYYRRERSWGSVSRRVALPGIVKDASVDAELKNGVLTLSIPLPKKAEPKQIEIKGE